MKKYHCFSFETKNEEESEILIAKLDMLNPIGFSEENQILSVYFDEHNVNKSEIEAIASETNVTFSESEEKEQNWNADWESSFEPISVYDTEDNSLFAFVRASFHEKNSLAKYDLEITPKMSFGTGHHATTYLMMETMRSIDFNGKHLIDFGTGTGVLAILAEKMGAQKIIAIDNDDWSLENTSENLKNNHCNKSVLVKADALVTESTEEVDVILANINFNVIVENLENIKKHTKKSGIVLFSGILENDVPQLTEILKNHGIYTDQVKIKNGWAMLKTTAY